MFVSLSMPRPTATPGRPGRAAKASGRPPRLRQRRLRDTVAQVQGLIGSRQVAVQIDPQAFDRYAVTRVPTFVLGATASRPACASGSLRRRQFPADLRRREPGLRAGTHAALGRFGPPADAS